MYIIIYQMQYAVTILNITTVTEWTMYRLAVSVVSVIIKITDVAPWETLCACQRKIVLLGTTQPSHDWKWSRLRLCDIHAQSFISLNSLAVESAASIVIMQTPLCNGDPLKRQSSGCVRPNVIQGCALCQCHTLIKSPWTQRNRTYVTRQSWTDLRPTGLHTCVTATWAMSVSECEDVLFRNRRGKANF